jgi:hypothetical protein
MIKAIYDAIKFGEIQLSGMSIKFGTYLNQEYFSMVNMFYFLLFKHVFLFMFQSPMERVIHKIKPIIIIFNSNNNNSHKSLNKNQRKNQSEY